jgi:hypothetical protein
MSSGDTTPEETPRPVPGFEDLSWVGEPLRLTFQPGRGSFPRVVAIGGADAGLLHLATGGTHPEAVVSWLLAGAFDCWPPAVSGPTEHVRRTEISNYLVEPFVLPGGRFSLPPQGDVGTWGHAGMAAASAEDVATFREHDPWASFDRPPYRHRRVVPVTLDDGSRLAAVAPLRARERGGAAAETAAGATEEVEIVRCVDGVLASCGALVGPAGALQTVIPRSGGAWLVFEGPDGGFVLGIDTDGRPVGEPWRLPFHQAFRRCFKTYTRWRDGFIVAIQGGRTTRLFASDGVHTTRVGSAPGGDIPHGRAPSLAISPDGRSVLVAQQVVVESAPGVPTGLALQIARADLAAGDGFGAAEIWAIDRDARARAEAADAARAAAPPKLRGRPLESADVGQVGADAEGSSVSDILHSKERMVGQARLRHLLSAIRSVHAEAGTDLQGDSTAGQHIHGDEAGESVLVIWNAEGLVAAAGAAGGGSRRSTERFLRKVPQELAPLVAQVLELTGDELCGATWVTAGEHPRWDEDGEIEPLRGYALTPEAALFAPGGWLERAGSSDAQGRLAIRLTEASFRGAHSITDEEEAALLASPDGAAATSERLAAAVALLSQAGITWQLRAPQGPV